jgi:hypothetical protein
METIEYRTVDKSKWGPGPWDGEPDKRQWQDKATGLPCLIVRNPGGALCGYVGLSEGHPLYGKDESDCPHDIDVHGGLTFADFCADTNDESRHVCHKPSPEEPDHVWWLGFDCSHSGDVRPADHCVRGIGYGPSSLGESYKTIGYVTRQVESLARQLYEVGVPSL